jgi:hypothetical protein
MLVVAEEQHIKAELLELVVLVVAEMQLLE